MYKDVNSPTVNERCPKYFEIQRWNSHYFAHKQMTSVETAVIYYLWVSNKNILFKLNSLFNRAVMYEAYSLTSQELLI
jgi:hypothetical protein